MKNVQKEQLIIIGGGEDKQAGKEILKEVVTLAGGAKASMAVITTASNCPLEAGEEYRRAFLDLGVGKVATINISSRSEANEGHILEDLATINGIFFVGGDQLRISSILGGTNFHYYIKNRLRDGIIVAGTSAGASMMSEVMVVEGDDVDAPRKCTVKMAPGMGFVEGVIIDQHFNQRGRIGRLLGAVAQNPYSLGIGIDEDTGVVVGNNRLVRVIGSGVITVVDGSNIEFTNISEQYPDEPLAITNVNIHILPTSYKFDLKSRRAIIA